MKKLTLTLALLACVAALAFIARAQIASGTGTWTKVWQARTFTVNFNSAGTQIESARMTGQYVTIDDGSGKIIKPWSEEAVNLNSSNLIEQLDAVGLSATVVNTKLLQLIYTIKGDTNVVWQ